jgi:transposase
MRGERDCVGVVLAESSRLLTTSQEEVAPCAPSAWTSIAPSPRWWRGATGWSPGWAGSTCGRDRLEAFARLTLRHDHHVVVGATGNAAAVVEVLSLHVGRVVIANPKQVRVIADAKINTDTIGATVLAKLSGSGFLPEVWMPDARTEAMRRQVTRRTPLVRQRTRRKTIVESMLHAHLVPPLSAWRPVRQGRARQAGGAWLLEGERMAVERHVRELDRLGEDLSGVERDIARRAL